MSEVPTDAHGQIGPLTLPQDASGLRTPALRLEPLKDRKPENRRVQMLNARIRELEKKLQRADAALHEQTARTRHVEALAQSFEHQVAVRERTLRALVGSVSWRVTAPLRRAHRLKGMALPLLKAGLWRTFVRIPLPAHAKDRLRDMLFHLAGPVFARTTMYRQWRQERDTAALGAAEGLPQQSARALDDDYSLAVPFGFAQPLGAPRLAVICHLYHADLAHEFRRYLKNIPFAFDLFVTTDTAAKRAYIAAVFAGWPRISFRLTANRGRDIAPKLTAFPEAYGSHDYVLHLHSKMSAHDPALAAWRGYVLETLLGSPEIVASVFTAFGNRPDLGMIAAQHFEPVRHGVGWGRNYGAARRLAQRMGIEIPPSRALDFPSGSMFWARSSALRPLLALGLKSEDFEPEQGQLDGTLAHAVERLYFHVCERSGLKWAKIAHPPLVPRTPAIIAAATLEAFDRFVDHFAVALGADGAPVPRAQAPAPVPPAPALIDQLQNRNLGAGRAITPGTAVAIGIIPGSAGEAQLERIVSSARRALVEADVFAGSRVIVRDDESRFETVGGRGTAVTSFKHQPPGHGPPMAEAFSEGAAVYIAADGRGEFHPRAIRAMLEMLEAHEYRALVDAARFPAGDAKDFDPLTFETLWTSSTCLAIPRGAFDTLGGLDAPFPKDAGDMDYAWRAREHGFALRTCPAALFLTPTAGRQNADPVAHPCAMGRLGKGAA